MENENPQVLKTIEYAHIYDKTIAIKLQIPFMKYKSRKKNTKKEKR